jgi:hypothetical protein
MTHAEVHAAGEVGCAPEQVCSGAVQEKLEQCRKLLAENFSFPKTGLPEDGSFFQFQFQIMARYMLLWCCEHPQAMQEDITNEEASFIGSTSKADDRLFADNTGDKGPIRRLATRVARGAGPELFAILRAYVQGEASISAEGFREFILNPAATTKTTRTLH